MELKTDDIVPANPFDLAGRSLVFTPDGSGGYSRSVHALAWEEDIGSPEKNNAEIELPFQFRFSGQDWGSFFLSRYGLVTFDEPYPFPRNGPDRWGTMSQIAAHISSLNAISALYKPMLGGWSPWDADEAGNTQHVSRRPDRVVLTWITEDHRFYVHGRPHTEKTRFQMVLHADGRVAFNYAPEPENSEEAIRDGIVGLFPGASQTELIARISSATQSSAPDHLDLLEIAVHRTSHPDFVMVEFTTRGPIRPEPNLEFTYFLFVDADRPWWTDRYRDRDDQDLYWSVTVGPDGNSWTRGPGAVGSHWSDNRVFFTVRLSDLGVTSASVVANAGERNVATKSWGRPGNANTDPVLIEFPVAPELETDLSRPASRSSAAQHEVFQHVHPKDDLIPLACRIIDALGDEFDLIVFHSQFRTDHQFNGSWWGYYPGNVAVKGIGQERVHHRKSSCSARMRGQWNFPIWVKSSYVANIDGAGEYLASPKGLWHFGHEFTHTWTASVGYLNNGEYEPLHDGSHWVLALHTVAPFPWEGPPQGSIMGGRFWRENSDGTFTPVTTGWGGLSWLDLYLAGLATPSEVPDMFILRNLQETGGGWRGPHTGEKEVISIEQIIAAEGPRDPPAARSQKTFNAGFVYLTLPGEPPDPDLLELHALFVDGAVVYWRHVTGGRGSLTTKLVLLEGS